MNKTSGKNNWIGVIVILVIIIGAFFFVSSRKDDLADIPLIPSTAKDVKELSLFTQGLAASGIDADTIGFHGFSPDGKYFFMSVFSDPEDANTAYLVKVADGTVTKLPGLLERGINDNRYITLYSNEGVVIYYLETGEKRTFWLGENVHGGTLSPDGETFVANTDNGIKMVEVKTGVIKNYTHDQYDGAYAWFSDNLRVLGVEATDEKLTDGAGSARRVGIWDLMTGKFAPLTTTITEKTIRNLEWIVPDKIARVNAGWDDGSHDYIVDVEKGTTVDLGDTSGSLMGGVAVDSNRGLLALVGGDDLSPSGSKVVLYKGQDKKHELTLEKGYFRQNVHIVNDNTLIYLRRQMGEKGTTAQTLVTLDLSSGTETVLKEIEANAFAALSLARDHKTWVLSIGNEFYTGTI